MMLSGKDASLCRWCRVPCDWTSREYRAMKLCKPCYMEQPPMPMKVNHKELERRRALCLTKSQ